MKFFAMISILPFLLTGVNRVDGTAAATTLSEKDNSIQETTVSAGWDIPEEDGTDGEYSLPGDVPEEIGLLLEKYSRRYDLPLDVVVRLSEVESNHGEYTRSVHANFDGSFDIGILALNSNFIDYFGRRYFEGVPSDFDPYDPEDNIQTGLAYLAHLNRLTGGDIKLAVTAYNCGYRSMLTGDIPQSTRRYVNAVVYGMEL